MYLVFRYRLRPVLPSGRNFSRKTQGSEKTSAGPGKSGAKILTDLSIKGPRRGRIFLFCINTVIMLAENCNFTMIYSIFLYYFAVLIFEKSLIPVLLATMSIFYEEPNFFRQGQIWLIWPKSFARSWTH
jgi:hypothetical protein